MKSELVSLVALDLGVTYKEATRMVNSVFEHIGSDLKRGNNVVVTGFGTFVSRAKKSCRIRSIHGSTVKLPPMRTVDFRTGESLRKVVRRKTKTIY